MESIQKKKNSPFIVILGSCDRLMDSGGVPVGVKEYIPINKLDMDTMLREKWFPQTHSILDEKLKSKFLGILRSEIKEVKKLLEIQNFKYANEEIVTLPKKVISLILIYLYGKLYLSN